MAPAASLIWQPFGYVTLNEKTGQITCTKCGQTGMTIPNLNSSPDLDTVIAQQIALDDFAVEHWPGKCHHV